MVACSRPSWESSSLQHVLVLNFSALTIQCSLVTVGDVEAALLTAHELLRKSRMTGPLKSLLLARLMREEFLRANRDLCNAFSILCHGAVLVRFCELTRRSAVKGTCVSACSVL